MKKILFFGVVSIILFLPVGVKANTIYEIDMSIYVDQNGDALVTEKWDVDLSQGTEGYKPYYNLGNATITDFNVKLNDINYTTLNNWNVNGNFQSKAYRNGINYINDGVELCWGISKYGKNVYTLTYKINGFVAQTDDSQIIYWTLIPHELSSKPKNVHIKIYSDNKYDQKLPVWGYGNYGGTAYVYDGYIEMNSKGTLNSNEYMTILVKFPLNTFNTTNIINNNFDYYYQMAESGARHYEEVDVPLNEIIGISILTLYFIVSIIPISFLLKPLTKEKNRVGSYKLIFKPAGKKIRNNIPNVREIPFDNDVHFAYWIATAYELGDKQTDFLGALLLKWLKEGKITIEKTVTDGVLKDRESSVINMSNNAYFENEYEQELYSMMKAASQGGILESSEFSNWCSINYERIFDWFNEVLDEQTLKLIKENKIVIKENRVKILSSNKYHVQPAMLEEAKKLKGLKNFLLEFSRIDERSAIEVNLWEYYLIYAQILGIADKVAKQFKNLYPELLENYVYDYDDIKFINHISYSVIRSAEMARSISESRSSSYSSGGGGHSSGGGGGGSFGGGSRGGGGFR